MTLPLALFHGFTGNPKNFTTVLRALAPSPPRVQTPTLVGHGAKASEASTFDGEVERLAAELRAHAPRWHLAGYSLGGRVALGLLTRYPELFVSATLIGAYPGLRTASERAERRGADDVWCRLLEERGIVPFVDAWQGLPLFATQRRLPRETLDAQRASRLAHDPFGLARSLRVLGLGAMPSYSEGLASMTLPVTLMAGALDEKFAVIAREMAAALPCATVDIVPDSGHNVVLERPDAVARALSVHLSRLDE